MPPEIVQVEYLYCYSTFVEDILYANVYKRLNYDLCADYCEAAEPGGSTHDFEVCYQALMEVQQLWEKKRREEQLIGTTFIILGITIFTLMTLLGFFLMYSKRLRKHPYGLYAIELLACACNYQEMYAWYFSGSFAALLSKEFMFVIGREPTFRNMFWLYNLMDATYYIINGLCFLLYPLINTLLFIDLFWIIKNPFYPQRKRITCYKFMAVITFTIQVVQIFFALSAYGGFLFID